MIRSRSEGNRKRKRRANRAVESDKTGGPSAKSQPEVILSTSVPVLEDSSTTSVVIESVSELPSVKTTSLMETIPVVVASASSNNNIVVNSEQCLTLYSVVSITEIDKTPNIRISNDKETVVSYPSGLAGGGCDEIVIFPVYPQSPTNSCISDSPVISAVSDRTTATAFRTDVMPSVIMKWSWKQFDAEQKDGESGGVGDPPKEADSGIAYCIDFYMDRERKRERIARYIYRRLPLSAKRFRH